MFNQLSKALETEGEELVSKLKVNRGLFGNGVRQHP